MTRRRHSRVAPTHHELVAVTEKLEVARKGRHVLERRRDGLVFLLLDVLERYRTLRTRLDEEFDEAAGLHTRGAEREGEIALRELAEARATHPELLLVETKLSGLVVPLFLSTHITTRIEDRGYGIIGTSSLDDEIAGAYESVLETAVKLAETTDVARRLAAETYRLRVRVNYLSHRLIPDFEADERYIERSLAQREQEERYRQFRVKRRREEHRASRRRREAGDGRDETGEE
ncbi:V-type ATP synthase subunit D [Halogeometricum pallidum JCM 14848]|uniref:A-type ATP synthase subunit D n=1 Tax=Halogeometricum pallidum JCM 14848 TaxID=1227487 RepID=M0DI85_HALPD|nr:V-type ATP synthase subunit D [Halogeometricum pallidum]ELZ33894.1 V-type ATP synthase subunit D [Halogeometricum pallidum JCM 14848]